MSSTVCSRAEMSPYPKLSLYVPCYNAERHIAACLEGVLAQRLRPAEILVIDDGSQDGTVEIASRYPVKILRHEQNRGLAAARNTAFRSARHELVAALDADCVPEPAWLEHLVSHFADENVVGASGRLEEAVQTSVADRWRKTHMPQHWGDAPLRDLPALYGANTVYRKSAILEAGGYDERCRTNGEDRDISARIHARGGATIYDPTAIVHHHRHDSVASILDTYWRWYHPAVYAMGHRITLGHLMDKAFNYHFRGHLNTARRDLRAGRLELVPLDVLASVYMPCRALHLYWSNRKTSRPRQIPAES
jgi:glycosyltransferase involved in cell wall biosynthesis